MAHHKSALKRIKISEKARLVNRRYRKALKESIKDLMESKSSGDATTKLNNTISLIDKLVVKRIVNKNKAAREKSKLTRFVNNLS